MHWSASAFVIAILPPMAIAVAIWHPAMLDLSGGQARSEIAIAFACFASLIATGGLWRRCHSLQRRLEEMSLGPVEARAILDSAVPAIILLNPHGRIVQVNRAAEQIFGRSKAALIHRDITSLLDIAPGEGPFVERLGVGPGGLAAPVRAKTSVVSASGDPIAVEVTFGLMQGGDGMHIVATVIQANGREGADEARDVLLATIGHEIRTPLTSIIGSLGLLKLLHGSAPPEQSYGLIGLAESNAKRLVRIADDLLDSEMLRLGMMRFSMAPVDLRDVATRARDAMQGYADTRGVVLRSDLPGAAIVVCGDQDRLVQVATNLLSNAIKFSPPGEHVDISVSSDAHSGRITVGDRGAGIPDELRPRLFSRFAQARRGAGRATPGTGLGLNIARDIIARHGGDITFHDNLPAGTMFTFNIPAMSADQRRNMDEETTILLCVAHAEMLASALNDEGTPADIVHSIPEAVTAMTRRNYRAMILDMALGGYRTPQTIQAIRTSPGGATMPIVAVIDDPSKEELDALAAMDIVDWISRPPSAMALNGAIAAAIAHASDALPLILHIDADQDILNSVAAALHPHARIVQARDVTSAETFLADGPVDMLIVGDGLASDRVPDLLSRLSIEGRTLPPMILYSGSDIEPCGLPQVAAAVQKSDGSLTRLVETVLSHWSRAMKAA